MDIVIFERRDLEHLIDVFKGIVNEDVWGNGPSVLRFAVEGGLKIKADGGMWSPPLGRMADPGGY